MSVAGPRPSGSRPLHNPLALSSPERVNKRVRVKKGKSLAETAAPPLATEESKRTPTIEDATVGDVQWEWASLTETGASRIPPLFTRDGSYFFTITGTSIKILSSTTGQLVSTLSSSPSRSPSDDGGRHKDSITGAVINPENPYQLITTSLDGTIKLWDFLDGVLLQTIDLKQSIFQLCAHEKFKGYVFVSVARQTKRKNKSGVETEDNVAVLRVSLRPSDATTQSAVTTSAEITAYGKTRFMRGLGLSASGDWLVGIGGHKSYVARTDSPKAGFTKFVSPERLVCLAFHPSDDYFATGDDKGNIRSWYCLREEFMVKSVGTEKRAQTTTLHWHAHAVSALSFTPNGAYLLSGGEESVLVVWQLHTGKKEFIPRLGAPIATISIVKAADRDEEYALGLTDASYAFVSSATMKISRGFSRIKLDPATPQLATTDTQTPLAVHARSSTLILPSSHPSTLQAYSPSSSRVVLELEVSPSNRVSRREESPIEPSRVNICTIAPQGDWMATLETREGDGTFRGDICLKLWWWDWKAGHWTLNSRIDRPHGLKAITSLSFNPASQKNSTLLLVTTGADGNIKTWRIRSTTTKVGDVDDFWVTRSSSSFRFETPRHASWSLDGSLLSVVFASSVVLFDPLNNAVRAILPVGEGDAIMSSYFVGRNGKYLVVVGSFNLVLWDLVSQTVQWQTHLSLPIKAVISHHHEESFVVFAHPSTTHSRHTSQVFVFTPASSKPLRMRVLPFQTRSIAWYPTPADARSASFSLVAVTRTWGVVLFGDDIMIPEDEGSVVKGLGSIPSSIAGPSRTLFQDIFGQSAFTDVSAKRLMATPALPVTTTAGKHSSSTQILNTPAYLLPPLESLFNAVMDGLLAERVYGEVVEEPTVANADNADEEEVDMDVDDISPVLSKRTERIVDGQEMSMFIDLFRHHAVKAPPPILTPPFGARPNGTPKLKANGVYRPAATSATPPATLVNKTLPRPTGAVSRSGLDDVSSPAAVNKKRKKSLS